MWGVMCQLARLVVVHAILTAVYTCQLVFSALPLAGVAIPADGLVVASVSLSHELSSSMEERE